MPRVIYLGFFALSEQTPITLSALLQAPEEAGVLTLTVSSDSQFDILSSWLQDEINPEVLMIWPKPNAFIADCLARDETIDYSLVEWKNMAERLLNLLSRHRGQLTLLGMAPGEVLALTNELPAEIAEALNQVEETVKRLPQAKSIHRLAVAQLPVEDVALQEVLAFLIANSYACSAPTEQTGETVRSVLQSAYKSHLVNQQVKTLTPNRDSSAEEKKLLASQLHEVQTALKVVESKANGRDSAQEENESLLTQLHLVQDECEGASLARQSSLSGAESKEQLRLKGVLAWSRVCARHGSGVAYNGSKNKALQEQMDLSEESKLFDAEWYLNQYNDVAQANIKPAEHLIKPGAIEGRNPSHHFNTELYMLNYPDITSSGFNPMFHYLRDGITEQCKTQEPPK